MIYSTISEYTGSYLCSTGEHVGLEEGILLSDYTDIDDELTSEEFEEFLNYVVKINARRNPTFIDPVIMMITNGRSKSCRVLVDGSKLKAEPEIEDPKGDADYYYYKD